MRTHADPVAMTGFLHKRVDTLDDRRVPPRVEISREDAPFPASCAGLILVVSLIVPHPCAMVFEAANFASISVRKAGSGDVRKIHAASGRRPHISTSINCRRMRPSRQLRAAFASTASGLRAGILDAYVPRRNRARDETSAALDPIRQDICSKIATQALHACDHDLVGAARLRCRLPWR